VCTSLSWSKQCLQKAEQLQDVLGLLTPPDTSSKDQDAAAAAAGDSAGGGGVRHCLVLCQELVKELKQFGQDLFEEWQVRWWCHSEGWGVAGFAVSIDQAQPVHQTTHVCMCTCPWGARVQLLLGQG
jgi:hypothetical protein